MNWMQRCAAAATVGALAISAAQAQNSRAECEKAYKPQVGQSGKDVVWVPTPDELVARMLGMAKVTKDDFVIDLGAGDGKIAIAAAKGFGARSLGIEFNPDLAKLAQCMVKVEGVSSRSSIIQGDIFKEDFSKATVVTMYLLPELNLCVRHRILAMAPGTRVTSHQFTMGEWEADQTSELDYRTAYLWIVPARVEGAWTFKDQGGASYSMTLSQKFQKIGGDILVGKSRQPLVGATLRGDEIKFAFNDEKGVTRTFSGRISGTKSTGALRAAGGGESGATGSATAVKAGAWADRYTGCERFYGGQ